jgi:hypothetical protein
VLSPKTQEYRFDARIKYFLNRHSLLYPQKSSLLEEFTANSSTTQWLTQHESEIRTVLKSLGEHDLRLYAEWWKRDAQDYYLDWEREIAASVLPET